MKVFRGTYYEARPFNDGQHYTLHRRGEVDGFVMGRQFTADRAALIVEAADHAFGDGFRRARHAAKSAVDELDDVLLPLHAVAASDH